MTYRAQRIDHQNQTDARFIDNNVRFLPEFKFNCSSTNINSLVLGIDVLTVDSNHVLFPKVQIFRPDVYSAQYVLVTGSERTIYYSTSNVSTSGVFEYPLNPPIPVMSGDLLAISAPREGDSIVRVYFISNISGVAFISSQAQAPRTTSISVNFPLVTDELILVYPVTGKTHIHCIIELLYYH